MLLTEHSLMVKDDLILKLLFFSDTEPMVSKVSSSFLLISNEKYIANKNIHEAVHFIQK